MRLSTIAGSQVFNGLKFFLKPVKFVRIIKDLGFYNPITKELKLDVENIRYQLKNGVQPTKSVKNLLFKQNILQANAG